MEQSIKPIKIKNAFAEKGTRDNYNCFGCSPYNEHGLQLKFWETGDELYAQWKPRKALEGWQDMLHGGIQAVLMDELAGWIVLVKLKTSWCYIRTKCEIFETFDYFERRSNCTWKSNFIGKQVCKNFLGAV